MREIKFRGQDIITKNWVYGDLEHCNNKLRIHTYSHTVHEVYPKTVGQYTGLKDKNGREIFEGDIVFIDAEEDNFEVLWNREMSRFILESIDLVVDFDNFYGSEMEVVSKRTKEIKCEKIKMIYLFDLIEAMEGDKLEIITHGNTFNKGICSNCGCKFLFSEKDVKKSVDSDWLICPECAFRIELEEER